MEKKGVTYGSNGTVVPIDVSTIVENSSSKDEEMGMLESLEETTVEEVNDLFKSYELEKKRAEEAEQKADNAEKRADNAEKKLKDLRIREIEKSLYTLKSCFKDNSPKYKLFNDLFYELADNLEDIPSI